MNFGKQNFNRFNQEYAYQLQQDTETTLFQEAKETYDYNSSHGYPIMVYEVVLKNTLTYNRNAIISLYSDTYTYTGGAHGNTVRKSQNWNLQLGRQFSLNTLFPNQPYFILSILKQINQQIQNQIENGTGVYFDDSCQLVIENFNPQNFYLFPTHFEIFFQQYEIAPYSSGIPTFKLTNRPLK